jgi:hypothetical protein
MGGVYQTAGRAVVALVLVLAGGCAPKPIALPAGDGQPYADFAGPLESATEGCRDVRTITAELGLSGRVGQTRLRGRALVGASAPDGIRLEALAPFGPPVFVLAARGGRGTLLLPRDDRVLRETPAEAIVEALTGVRIDPASLRAALSGCAASIAGAVSARSFDDRWLSIAGPSGDTLFLERQGAAWRVRGARTPAFTVTYDELGAIVPARMTIRAAGHVPAEVRLRLSQVEINGPLAPETFEVHVPPDAVPLTLDELRQAGPLGEKR